MSDAVNTLIVFHWSATASYSAASSMCMRKQSSLVRLCAIPDSISADIFVGNRKSAGDPITRLARQTSWPASATKQPRWRNSADKSDCAHP